MKKLFVSSIFLLTILVFAGCSGNTDQVVQDSSNIIFFYGKECPHCQKVEEYFSENKVAEKVQFSQREVYHDKANATFMAQKAKQCGLDEKSLGVPLLWVEGKCYSGDTDIIQFFNDNLNKANGKN